MNAIQNVGSPENSAAQLHRAAVAFEGFFHGLLLRTMRKGIHENPKFHGGSGEAVFRGLSDDMMADRMAEGGELGIAKMIEKDLGSHLDTRG